MKSVAEISPAKCDRRPTCPAMRMCPQKAIRQVDAQGNPASFGGLSVVDESKCTGCGICMRYCPMTAIAMKEMAA